MHVILFYEHIDREFESLKRIASYLENANKAKTKLFSIIYEVKEAISYARKNGIDVVVLPWAYTSHDFYPVVPFFSINPNVVIANLHQEQISAPAYEKILFPSSDDTKWRCHHFVWGDFFANKLYGMGVSPTLVHVVGSSRLEAVDACVSSGPCTKAELAASYSLGLEKQWVLYAENRGWVFHVDQRKIDSLRSRGVSEEIVADRRQLFLKSLDLTIDQINHLSDAFFEQFELIYRPHPGTKASEITNPKVRIISELPIGKWLCGVDLLCVWTSTSAFEAEVAGVPVLRHEAIPNKEEYLTYGLDAFPAIQEIADISPDLIGEERLRQSGRNVYRRYYGECDGRSAERTASTILQLSTCGKPRYSFMEEIRCRLRIARKCMVGVVARFAIRTRMAEKTGFPRIISNTYRDIPPTLINGKRKED